MPKYICTGTHDSHLGSALYRDAWSKGLMDEGDQPISRRKSARGKVVKDRRHLVLGMLH